MKVLIFKGAVMKVITAAAVEINEIFNGDDVSQYKYNGASSASYPNAVNQFFKRFKASH